jgi:hypothetical protein
MHVKLPHEPFNSAVRKGTAGETMQRILAGMKPEAVYFTEYGGRRGAIIIVDIAEASKAPAMAEPWFLSFNADVEFHFVMTPEDLGRSGIDQIGKNWPPVS